MRQWHKQAILAVVACLLAGGAALAAPVATGPATAPAAAGGAGQKLAVDIYGGYFVKNTFEAEAAESYVVIRSQKEFDDVFGVGFVMGDKAHRLAEDAFDKLIVIAPIKRGAAMWEFKEVTAARAGDVVTLSYTTKKTPSATATFSVPLIVSIPKGPCAKVRFVEDGKEVKALAVPPVKVPAGATVVPDKPAKK